MRINLKYKLIILISIFSINSSFCMILNRTSKSFHKSLCLNLLSKSYSYRAYSKLYNAFVDQLDQRTMKCPCDDDNCKSKSVVPKEQNYGYFSSPKTYKVITKKNKKSDSYTCRYITLSDKDDLNKYITNGKIFPVDLPENFEDNLEVYLNTLDPKIVRQIKFEIGEAASYYGSPFWFIESEISALKKLDPCIKTHMYSMIYDLATNRGFCCEQTFNMGCIRHYSSSSSSSDSQNNISSFENIVELRSDYPIDERDYVIFLPGSCELTEENSYSVLGVKPSDSLEKIKTAYFDLKIKHEKDKQKLELITKAYRKIQSIKYQSQGLLNEQV